MIDRDSLLLYKTFPTAIQIEKDYLQHLILMGMYERVSNNVVFKGGTALQKVYGVERFSEDLDFAMNADSLTEIDDGLENASKYCEILEDIGAGRRTIAGVTSFTLRIRGPISIHSVSVDVSDEHTLLSPLLRQIKPVYGDLRPYIVAVMDEREILAEKVRAVLSRKTKKARDIYDLYFILKNGVDIDVNLVYEKLRLINKRFSTDSFRNALEGMRSAWPDLKEYVNDLPDYGAATAYILEKFDDLIWL